MMDPSIVQRWAGSDLCFPELLIRRDGTNNTSMVISGRERTVNFLILIYGDKNGIQCLGCG